MSKYNLQNHLQLEDLYYNYLINSENFSSEMEARKTRKGKKPATNLENNKPHFTSFFLVYESSLSLYLLKIRPIEKSQDIFLLHAI